MRIVICNDERGICSLIESFIEEYMKDNKEQLDVQVFYSGEALIEYMENGNRVDLLFLNIYFSNGMSGVEVGHVIRNRLDDQTLKLVYVLGGNEYDRQLFDYQPMNFIEKPIRKDKVVEVIARAKKLLEISESMFYYSKGRGLERVRYRDIMYFESQGRSIMIHLCYGKEEFYGKIKDVGKKVSDKGFVQIHRSYRLIRNFNLFSPFIMNSHKYFDFPMQKSED